jgi:hypothetical protein
MQQYISFIEHHGETEDVGMDVEVFRVIPSEFRRQYVPESSDQLTTISGNEVTVMKMVYLESIIIVSLHNGTTIALDAIDAILDSSGELSHFSGKIDVKLMPANITIEFEMFDKNSMINLKKMITFCYPNLYTTNVYQNESIIAVERGENSHRDNRNLPIPFAVAIDG